MTQPLSNEQHDQLQRLYDTMAEAHLYPLWEVLGTIVRSTPVTRAVASRWRYQDMRNHLLRAGDLISAEEAERRVLILENPGMRGESGITPRLYAGLQLVLPGEVAACHRHSQSALRFVMEGSGAYTAVDGEKAYMAPFDLVLTPNWRWHDHGNPSQEPVIWLDGLDIPTVRAMEGEFAERLGEAMHVETDPPGTNRLRYGKALRPLRSGTAPHPSPREPLFHYPYAEWNAALSALSTSQAPDPYLGHALEFTNPRTAGPIMPTISAHVRSLPAGFETGVRRSTEGAVFTVVEGSGEIEIDDETFTLAERDVVVVPTWKAVRWRAHSRLVLFGFSDRVTQEVLGLYRELLS